MFFLCRDNYITLWQLLKRSYFVFLTYAKDSIINSLIWTISVTLVYHFIMPQVGLTDFGTFMLASSTASIGFFGVLTNVIILVGDITGDNALSYELTLPIPHWLVLTKIALANAYQAFLQAILILPIGKIILWNSMPIPYFSPIKFIVILMLISLFAGFFSLFLASILQSMEKIDDLWDTILFPMWYLGGFNFHWHSGYKVFPYLGYLTLCNPLTYAFEGIRGAILDPSLSIPFHYCCFALLGFIILFGYIGISIFKKRLDCI
jgi:ABC-type polysaccharide/polyol phosphate export permease